MRRFQAVSLSILFCGISLAAELPTATKIYSELNKQNPAGLTRDEVIAYLRKYDPRFNVPEYLDFARSNPGFRHVMDKLIAKAADDIMLSGIGSGEGPNATPTVLPRKDFLAQVAKTNPAIPKEFKRDYLADFSKHVLHMPGLFSDPNLTIAKSTTLASDVKNPAQFSWTSDKGKSVFTVDGAVSYKFSPPGLLQFPGTSLSITSINPAFEIHESSSLKNQQDSISAKMPAVLAWNFLQNNPLQTAIFYISPTYETDKAKSTETYGVDILFGPIVSTEIAGYPIQTGQFISASAIFRGIKAEYPGIRFMPYLGFENGYASFPGGQSVYDNQRDFSRFVARLKTDIFLSPRLDIAIDFYHRTFLTGGNDSFDFVDISPILYLDGDPENPETQHFSLGMTFKDGKTTPQFKNVRTISAWLGVKF